MVNNIKLIFYFTFQLFLVSLAGCQNNKINTAIEESRSQFHDSFLIDSIFSHVPIDINSSEFLSGFFSPPQKGNCFGEVFIVTKLNEKVLKTFANKTFLTIDSLKSNKFLLLEHHFVNDNIYNSKQSIDTSFKYPIANLNQNDFSLGEIPDSIFLKDQKVFISIPKYKMPYDLTIYLIDAQYGDYWKSGCNKFRSKFLGKWKNGFSKGYAISKKEKIIVYWLVAW